MIHLEKVSDRFDKLEIHKPKFNRHRELLKDYSLGAWKSVLFKM